MSSHRSQERCPERGRKGGYQKSAGSKVRIQVGKRKVKAYVIIRASG